MGDPRPIGVFDSGIGGLTVLKALWERLPNESTLYLGDTARVPYGTKSAEVVTRYTEQNARFLIERDIKLLVVACNTASAVALPHLERRLQVPVLGVISPGAQAAAERSRSGRIGVIGTAGTIRSGAYARALEAVRPGVEVVGKACPLFVALAEEGWVSGEVPRLVAREYLAELKDAGVDTLVLGCTHYPLLKPLLHTLLGADVRLIDSAEETAAETARVLAEAGLDAPNDARPTYRFVCSDDPARFLTLGQRFLGGAIDHVERHPLG
jgi:glutamate racemase